ncbi:MAG: ATP-grasp domain-containing protein [Acidimicrobiales bacterium]|nr:MAG: ATP-grasp domain-containing protein [Acidimicrobiales bacterium]
MISALFAALVTAPEFHRLDDDLAPLRNALGERGLEAALVDWDDRHVDWSAFDAVVLRSPWDYTWRLDEFLAWAEHVASVTTLLNPLGVVRWNTDKHYLLHLAQAGVPVVPTTILEPGDEVETAGLFFDGYEEIVVKPAISAGSRDTDRYSATRSTEALAHAERLLLQGRSVLVQPYIPSVDERGETALVYVDDRLTHAFSKGPMLVDGVGFVEGLYKEETVSPHEPDHAEVKVAEQALDAVGRCLTGLDRSDLLYARVDLVTDVDGSPRVLELELVEPAFFATRVPGALDKVADSIVRGVSRILGRRQARRPGSDSSPGVTT